MPEGSPTISVKRESWKNGYHTVARRSGRFVATRKWSSKKDTQIIEDIVVHIESFPETYKPSKQKKKVSLSYNFHRTGIRPDKYVYVLLAKFGKEFRNFSMTSNELYRMDESARASLYAQTKHAYNDSDLEDLRIIRIYNSYTMENIRRY